MNFRVILSSQVCAQIIRLQAKLFLLSAIIKHTSCGGADISNQRGRLGGLRHRALRNKVREPRPKVNVYLAPNVTYMHPIWLLGCGITSPAHCLIQKCGHTHLSFRTLTHFFLSISPTAINPRYVSFFGGQHLYPFIIPGYCQVNPNWVSV